MPRRRGGRNTSTLRRSAAPSSSSGSPGKTALAFAFVLGAGAAVGAGYLYRHSTPQPPAAPAPSNTQSAPVARAKAPQPVVATPPRTPPFGTSEDVFEAGAHLYAGRCAGCHGTPHADAAGKPTVPQLLRKAKPKLTTTGPAELYEQIAAGAPAKGMPAYARVLTDTQIWQLALLLKNAGEDLPDPVVQILNTPSKRPTAASK